MQQLIYTTADTKISKNKGINCVSNVVLLQISLYAEKHAIGR